MVGWKLKQYTDIGKAFLDNCSSKMQEVLERRLGRLSEIGHEARPPLSKHIRNRLFELRAKADKKWARLIFYFGKNRTIVFVHAFYKKSNKISDNDIEIAERNRKNIIEEGGESHDFNYIH